MRKAVFLSYTFPPQTSGATPVIMNLVKYLPEFNWDVLPLVAANPSGVMPLDPSLCEMLPEDLRVTRVFHPDPMQMLSRIRGRDIQGQPHSVPSEGGPGLLKRFLHNYLLVPDRIITWLPAVIPAGLQLIEGEKADAIISHGPHHSTHILAFLLSRISGIPHVAYFGDLWIYDSNVPWSSRLNLGLEKAMERMIIRNSAGVMASTPESLEYFRRTYGEECPPGETLDNGYDPESPEPGEVTIPPRQHLLITFTGNFWGTHSPVYVFRGLREYLRRHPESRIKLQIVGNLAPAFKDLPQQLGIQDHLILEGVVPHSKVGEYQMAADVLLACLSPLPGSELKNSSKMAEYLRTGKPVLAVAPPGSMRGYVERFDAGYTCDTDPSSIADTLEIIMEDWENSRLNRNTRPEEVAQVFDGRMIMGRVASFLNSIIEDDFAN